jgi:hypothetical protein
MLDPTKKPNLNDFLASDWSLLVYHDNRLLFSSRESDLIGLSEYLRQPDRPSEIEIFDRFVGRAAAMLMSLAGATAVRTGVLSHSAREFLAALNIPVECREEARYLMDHASEGMCRWEKMAKDMSPETFALRLGIRLAPTELRTGDSSKEGPR